MADVAVEMVIVGKIILSILLVAGGLYAIHAGQRLFRDGIGLKAYDFASGEINML